MRDDLTVLVLTKKCEKPLRYKIKIKNKIHIGHVSCG